MIEPSWKNWTCPKCGDDVGFTLTRPARGKWVHSYYPSVLKNRTYCGAFDSEIETSTDHITEGPMPKTAECLACRKMVPNPLFGAEE